MTSLTLLLSVLLSLCSPPSHPHGTWSPDDTSGILRMTVDQPADFNSSVSPK